MTFKMIIAASLALGVQMASASSNCAANDNGQTIAEKSKKQAQTTVAAVMNDGVPRTHKDAPASTGTR